MSDSMLSAGIDIGTSTTQLIFCRLFIANTGGFGSVPKIEIVEKEILYRSRIYLTPLKGDEMIDGEKVAQLVRAEYQKAGIQPKDLATGAVIITGETARKRNAKEVVENLSQLAGDFVVAAAGPDLESVLAGKGSGAARLSKETGKIVANLDIGGGTTNIGVFEDGNVIDTACLNIGGRLIRIEDGKIAAVSKTLQPLLKDMNIDLKSGDTADKTQLAGVTKRMAEIIAEAIGYKERSNVFKECVTNHGLTGVKKPEYLVFSGGVADCMKQEKETYAYGDIGVLLGKAIVLSPYFKKQQMLQASETVHATVVGAGNFSMEVSGSTISYTKCQFPMKNVPVFSVKLETQEDIPVLASAIRQSMSRFYDTRVESTRVALTFSGLSCPNFKQIEAMAEQFVKAFEQEIKENCLPVLIVKADIGKALGQAIRRRLSADTTLICLDSISCQEGDYIDIGAPAAAGKVIPVVVKTLIFQT